MTPSSSGNSAEPAPAREPRPWEVWLAYVRFADHPDVGKVRPVVIIDEEVTAIVVAKVTTAEPQERFSYCELKDWQLEGLLRPSRAQVVPLFRVARADVLRDKPLGTLTERDRAALQAALDDGDGLLKSFDAGEDTEEHFDFDFDHPEFPNREDKDDNGGKA